MKSTTVTAGPRPELRTCIACMKTDGDPKHQFVAADHSSTFHHHDCGTAMDPPCQVCVVIMSEAPSGAKGDRLRAHQEAQPRYAWHQLDGLHGPLTRHPVDEIDGCEHCTPHTAEGPVDGPAVGSES